MKSMYFGFRCNPYRGWVTTGFVESDPLTGFIKGVHAPDLCDYFDTLNIAYYMDDDGDPIDGEFPVGSRRGAVGVMLLGASRPDLKVGYHWVFWDPSYSNDWGPRRKNSVEEPFRTFAPYLAWPGTDRNLYYLMSHPNIAYDQLFANVDHTAEGISGRLQCVCGHPGFAVCFRRKSAGRRERAVL